MAIESSCDDTAAAVLEGKRVLSNVVASQEVHRRYGGVVPELASRAHQKHIVPVVHQALAQANIDKKRLSAIAFTQGPGLMGSLLVGTSFAKSLAWSLGVPLIAVNHMEAHILAHFIDDGESEDPDFPFLALTVSGGHTQLVRVDAPLQMTVIGSTLDDAVGEAFDKSAKLLGLPYPGGPLIDRHAREGDPGAFPFSKPKVDGLNFSFSGIKTAIRYFLEEKESADPGFTQRRRADICASVQRALIDILMDKLERAVAETGLNTVAIGGGVAANSGLRERLARKGESEGWKVFVPRFEYCTDNAAMIGIAGYYRFQKGKDSDWSVSAASRMPVGSGGIG